MRFFYNVSEKGRRDALPGEEANGYNERSMGMNMKKWLRTGLVTVMTAAMLIGCGGGGGATTGQNADGATGASEAQATASADGVTTITLLSWYSEEYLGDFITRFEEENPNIHVDLQYVPPVQQYVDKFSVLVASGQMTDMFYTAAENKEDVIARGLALDLSDMEIFSRINPSISATYGADGEVYAYSPDAWIGGIFYNKTLFEEAGIEAVPATWDEFIEACEKLKAIGVEPYMDDADNVHNIPQDIGQCMVISQDPDADRKINNGELTFEEVYTEPFRIWYDELIASGLYSQASLGLNSDQVIDMFANGQLAMFHGGPWTISTIVDKNPDLDFDMFGLSDKDGNQVLPGALNVGMSISTSSAHQEECRAFIEFMSRDENIIAWQAVSNNAIVVQGVEYSMNPILDKFKEDAVNGNFYLPQIVWDNSAGIYKELLSAVQDTITGADTVDNIAVRLDEKRAELTR